MATKEKATKTKAKVPAKRTKASAAKTSARVSKKLTSPPVAKNLSRQTLDLFASRHLRLYGSYVVEDRAIADFRDGMKPVHRAILWSMYELGLHRSGVKHKKSARIVGDALGKYHPHGDSACYNAAVTLANAYTKLIDGQGNWGSPVDGAAAMRYTEARIAKFASTFLLDPQYLAVVPKESNYDGSEQIPRYFPALLPVLLLTGSVRVPAFGVSVGNPSFQLEGLTKLVVKGLSGKKVTTEDCVKHLVPEYPYGNEVILDDTYTDFMETGHGSLLVRPYVEALWEKKRIVIHNYCPGFNGVASVQKKIDSIANMTGVSSVGSPSKEYSKSVLEVRPSRGVSEDDFVELAKKIEKLLTTKDSFELGFVYKRDDDTTTFHKMGYARFINNWCVYRRKLEEDYVKHLIALEEKKLERLDLLAFAVKHREKIWDSVRAKGDARKVLAKKLKIDEDMSKQLLDIPNIRLTSLELSDLKAKAKEVKAEIKKLKADLKVPGKRAADETSRLVKNFLKTK